MESAYALLFFQTDTDILYYPYLDFRISPAFQYDSSAYAIFTGNIPQLCHYEMKHRHLIWEPKIGMV